MSNTLNMLVEQQCSNNFKNVESNLIKNKSV